MTSPVVGGLGIMDLGDMSFTMAAKWIFNYANGKETLWRKVVSARSKCNHNSLSALGNNGNCSVLLRFVNSVLCLVVDGRDLDFWNDD